MAHFAKVENGVVREVIVIGNENAPDEATGQQFIASIGLAGDWIQTSYNNNPVEGASRGKYAGIGDLWNGTEFTTPPPPEPLTVAIGWIYDADLDEFIAPPTPEADDDSVA